MGGYVSFVFFLLCKGVLNKKGGRIKNDTPQAKNKKLVETVSTLIANAIESKTGANTLSAFVASLSNDMTILDVTGSGIL
mmetsp:Transcript_12380/g.21026  ORF Transcript_12380/g.21026 Transcript_12380/m.21026 type:complete len:80 (-) Transcript_12380:166-405(-)